MKILFQGDSITEWNRDKSNPEDLGSGYVRVAAEAIAAMFPNEEFTFVNRGVSGDRTRELLKRWQEDTVDVQPDIMTLMIGVNDCWRRYDMNDPMTAEEYEQNLRSLLRDFKENTNAKLLMIEPFTVHEDTDLWREDLYLKINAYRRVAKEFADAYLPMDGIIAMLCVEAPPSHWSMDGIHLAEPGIERMGQYVAQAVAPLIRQVQSHV
ncbi:MAG: SGNH/GDSL hydrolase family protein [Clostridia bacterium]|nr:SGNH/GDSL hydrolase family protein [Clostridia bacterium]